MKNKQKVIVLGLEEAGKTSLLSTFGGNLGIDELASLEPTRGVKRNNIKTDDIEFHIWDFGGQVDHRIQYLEDPEAYFSKVDLLIYVIDVQVREKFDEGIKYFEKIIEILKDLNENPYILIFFHKVDPKIKNEEIIQENIRNLRKDFKTAMNNQKFKYDIFLTSIYSTFPQQPKFLGMVKDMIEGKSLEEVSIDSKIERIGSILKSTLDAVIQISSKVMDLENQMKLLIETPSELKSEEKAQKILREDVIAEFNNIILKKQNK